MAFRAGPHDVVTGHPRGAAGRADQSGRRVSLSALATIERVKRLEAVQEIADHSHGIWRPRPGSVHQAD